MDKSNSKTTLCLSLFSRCISKKMEPPASLATENQKRGIGTSQLPSYNGFSEQTLLKQTKKTSQIKIKTAFYFLKNIQKHNILQTIYYLP